MPMTTARDRPPEEAAEDTSFARGLRVLLTIADRGEIRADDLSTALDTPLSTIYRYLRTLTEFGFVERSEGGYRLGARLRLTGGPAVTSEELIRASGPVLSLLAEEVGETVVIVRRVGDAAICLHEVQAAQPLRVTFEPGASLPLHAGALARVLLAFADETVQDEALAEVTRPRRLRRELDRTAREGIARSDGEDFPGVVVVAVPVLRPDGIVAAIGILAPAVRAVGTWRARAARRLRGAAREVEDGLAGDASV